MAGWLRTFDLGFAALLAVLLPADARLVPDDLEDEGRVLPSTLDQVGPDGFVDFFVEVAGMKRYLCFVEAEERAYLAHMFWRAAIISWRLGVGENFRRCHGYRDVMQRSGNLLN